jgi:hypothetical protein
MAVITGIAAARVTGTHALFFRGIVGHRTDSRSFLGIIQHMPSYNIRIHRDSGVTDDSVEMPDVDAARREALLVFVDLARDLAFTLPDHPSWRIEVVELGGDRVFNLSVSAETA